MLLAACSSNATLTPEPPWTGRADVDDIAVANALTAILPDDQRACVEATLDGQQLLTLVTQQLDQVVDSRGFEPDDTFALGECLGEGGATNVVPTVLAATLETIPAASAPLDLGSITWPTTADAASDLMRAVADELGAELSEQGGRMRMNPGEGNADVVAMDWTTFAPGPNASQMITLFALGADWDVMEAARDGDIVWVRWTTSGNGEPFEVLQWGPVGTPWTYAVTGGTRAEIDSTTAAIIELATP